MLLWEEKKKTMLLSDKEKKITAYHEGGHALVAVYAPGAPEIRKATLIPRGDTLGLVNFLPSDEHLQTKEQLLVHLQMAMAGRAAEELIFGSEQVTTGASSDFMTATQTAFKMVTKVGMSKEVGHVYIYQDPENRDTFKGDQALIDKEVKRLLEDAYTIASEILKDKQDELHLLANALLQYETLDKDEILKVIKGEPLTEKDEKLRTDKALKVEKERKKEEEEKARQEARANEERQAVQGLKQNSNGTDERKKKGSKEV